MDVPAAFVASILDLEFEETGLKGGIMSLVSK